MAPGLSARQAIAARSQQSSGARWQMSRLSTVSPKSCSFPTEAPASLGGRRACNQMQLSWLAERHLVGTSCWCRAIGS